MEFKSVAHAKPLSVVHHMCGIAFFTSTVFAQKDSLILTNGDMMVGEIKSMDKGVLYMETPYSKNDFNIKWVEIREVYSSTRFLITLQDGSRINGNLHTNEAGNKTDYVYGLSLGWEL